MRRLLFLLLSIAYHNFVRRAARFTGHTRAVQLQRDRLILLLLSVGLGTSLLELALRTVFAALPSFLLK